MSTIIDDTYTDHRIALRVKAERERRGWSLAELSERSDVSKAMLSKIEREEVSPSAVILSRVATAFGHTLAELLASAQPRAALLRAREQPRWRDPASGYVRCQIFQSADNPMELIEVVLPPGAHVGFPSSAYTLIRQVVWLLSGRLEIREGDRISALKPGDRLEFGPPADSEFRNPGEIACRYLVALLRR